MSGGLCPRTIINITPSHFIALSIVCCIRSAYYIFCTCSAAMLLNWFDAVHSKPSFTLKVI